MLILKRSKLDVLVLGETFFLNSAVNREILICSGYEFHRFDRDGSGTNKGGGGIAMYVRSRYKFDYIEPWSFCNNDIEMMWVQLKLKRTQNTYIKEIDPESG